MPGMDGFGLQDNLAGATSDRPIIFLTGHGDIPASVKAIKAGAIDFLTKPVEAPALLAAISAALVRDLQVRSDAIQRQSVECRLASLTAREREVWLEGDLAGILSLASGTKKPAHPWDERVLLSLVAGACNHLYLRPAPHLHPIVLQMDIAGFGEVFRTAA